MTRDYAYSVARIRSLEPKLLDMTARRRILETSLTGLLIKPLKKVEREQSSTNLCAVTGGS